MSARLEKLAVDELTEQQRALYDSIAGGPRASGRQLFSLVDEVGRLEGPFNAMLLSPVVGNALQALGGAVRYGSAFTDRAREIAILVVADHWESAFEWYAHEAVGRAAGITDEELSALRDGRFDALTDDYERCVAEITAALCTDSDLTDAHYGAAIDVIGVELLFELTTLVGYYATLALQLRVFRVGLPT